MLGRSSSRGGSRSGRILTALIPAGISPVTCFGSQSLNPATGETQHVNNAIEATNAGEVADGIPEGLIP